MNKFLVLVSIVVLYWCAGGHIHFWSHRRAHFCFSQVVMNIVIYSSFRNAHLNWFGFKILQVLIHSNSTDWQIVINRISIAQTCQHHRVGLKLLPTFWPTIIIYLGVSHHEHRIKTVAQMLKSRYCAQTEIKVSGNTLQIWKSSVTDRGVSNIGHFRNP